MSQPIQHITDFQQYSQLIKLSPCIVKFTANWCGPCKRMTPAFEEFASKTKEQINFLEINIDLATKITDYEDVQSIPLIIFYKSGIKQNNLTIQGLNVIGFNNNAQTFITQVTMDNLAESNTSDNYTSESNTTPTSTNYNSDEDYNEYDADSEVPIEKTISEDMIRDNNSNE